MKATKNIPPKNVDAYLKAVPPTVRVKLEKMRKAIRSAAPGAEEVISYSMPAYKYHGMLVYFAAFKNHMGFYPFLSAINTFKKELSKYEGSKGTVRFPIDKPVPLGLVTKMVKFRVKENLEKAKAKKNGGNAARSARSKKSLK